MRPPALPSPSPFTSAAPVWSRLHGGRAGRRGLAASIAVAHGLVLWGLLQTDTVRVVTSEVAPLVVALIQAHTPAPLVPALPSPARPPAPQHPPPLPLPPVLGPDPAPAPWPARGTTPEPPAPEVPPPTPAVAAAPLPTPTSAPKRVPPGAVRYVVAPPLAVPTASRRLGEAGTVMLRVLVGTDGRPRRITLHQSSGFARLDEQALQAMRQALFEPYTENGVAVEAEVVAPCEYLID